MVWSCKECGAYCTIEQFEANDGLCPKCRHRDRRAEAGWVAPSAPISIAVDLASGPDVSVEFYRAVPGAPDPKSDPLAAAVDRAWSELAKGKLL